MRLQCCGIARDVHGDQVIRHDGPRAFEPERRQLRQHTAFVRNAGAKDVVERGDAIGGDEEQTIVDLVDVADLAATHQRQTVKVRFNDGMR